MDKILYISCLQHKQPKVWFDGNSLVLAEAYVTFKGIAEIRVIALDRPAIETELLAFDPSMIFFGTRALESEFLYAQLQELPGVLLIGVDLESHEVLLIG